MGGKFGGDHGTFIEVAATIADMAVKLPEVTCVSPGVFEHGTNKSSGGPRVKFMEMSGGLLLKVRMSLSVQEVRVITRNPQATMLSLARSARDEGISICFEKRQK